MMEVIDVPQGSPEWFAARLGIPTASMFATVMAKGQGKTRADYMRKLAGEILTGDPMETFSNGHMEHGKEVEAEARAAYEFLNDVEVREVGFVRNHGCGASPDGLIGDDGGMEIKRKLPHLLIECHERGDIPPAHMAQVQGCMWVTERKWWDFMAYWPKLPPFIVRVERDDAYIAELAAEVKAFKLQLDKMVDRMRERAA
jgi:hypothetical protein